MPEQGRPQPEEQSDGAPAWMLTFGDAVTLLLTFFVLLLTYSTPTEEDFQAFAQGLMAGTQRMSVLPAGHPAASLSRARRRLEESRLSTQGAEKPSMESESPIEDLKRHYEEIDISRLKSLKGAVVIRIPLGDLFGTGEELTQAGRDVLDRVVQMTRAKSYSIVVRVRPGKGVSAEERPLTSARLGVQVVGYLRRMASQKCRDVGLSNNVKLSEKPLSPGTCEIIMLEV